MADASGLRPARVSVCGCRASPMSTIGCHSVTQVRCTSAVSITTRPCSCSGDRRRPRGTSRHSNAANGASPAAGDAGWTRPPPMAADRAQVREIESCTREGAKDQSGLCDSRASGARTGRDSRASCRARSVNERTRVNTRNVQSTPTIQVATPSVSLPIVTTISADPTSAPCSMGALPVPTLVTVPALGRSASAWADAQPPTMRASASPSAETSLNSNRRGTPISVSRRERNVGIMVVATLAIDAMNWCTIVTGTGITVLGAHGVSRRLDRPRAADRPIPYRGI